MATIVRGARTASMGSSPRRVLHIQPRKRQIYTIADLNKEEEEVLVEWIRGNEWIYNRKLDDNKNVQKKENLWADKAKEMGKRGDQAINT